MFLNISKAHHENFPDEIHVLIGEGEKKKKIFSTVENVALRKGKP